MKEDLLADFETDVNRLLQPVIASPRRKRTMRQELLSHLLAIHEEELRDLKDDRAAMRAALRRFGDSDELARQLQASVPRIEQLFFLCLDQKETIMKPLLWIVAIAAIVAAENINFTDRELVLFAGVTLVSALIFVHLLRENNLAARLLGRRWPWLVGIATALFGSGMILPALAKLKHGGPWWSVVPAILGSSLMLCGFWFVSRGVRSRRAGVA